MPSVHLRRFRLPVYFTSVSRDRTRNAVPTMTEITRQHNNGIRYVFRADDVIQIFPDAVKRCCAFLKALNLRHLQLQERTGE